MTSAGEWEQIPMFASETPVPRPPGWCLIVDTSGARGWHLVDHTTPDRGVVTVCGITGRVITSDAGVITPCALCSAET